MVNCRRACKFARLYIRYNDIFARSARTIVYSRLLYKFIRNAVTDDKSKKNLNFDRKENRFQNYFRRYIESEEQRF